MNLEKITLSAGDGGRLTSQLIEEVFLKTYGNEILNKLDDSAELSINGDRIAFTTDSYVVKPIFFPGGDIGKLAICGTVNDLSVKGAKAVAISAGFIIEEGFSVYDLKRIVSSMHETTSELGISIVTGDTKVVSKGEADGIFINTSGIGTVIEGMNISSSNARVGDDIIISGTVADHGISILNARENLGFNPEIVSDVAPLCSLVEGLIEFAPSIHVMRDPTRGGVASSVNEIARSSKVDIKIFENYPIRNEVQACCDLLGFDPLYLANEGKLLLFVDPEVTDYILQKLKSSLLGLEAALIGKVCDFSGHTSPVYVETGLGSMRFLPMLEGQPLPRIC